MTQPTHVVDIDPQIHIGRNKGYRAIVTGLNLATIGRPAPDNLASGTLCLKQDKNPGISRCVIAAGIGSTTHFADIRYNAFPASPDYTLVEGKSLDPVGHPRLKHHVAKKLITLTGTCLTGSPYQRKFPS
jgi:hypothetical protein